MYPAPRFMREILATFGRICRALFSSKPKPNADSTFSGDGVRPVRVRARHPARRQCRRGALPLHIPLLQPGRRRQAHERGIQVRLALFLKRSDVMI